MLGNGGYGVAPPSINPQKGSYRFLKGHPGLITELPTIAPGALPAPDKAGAAAGNAEIGECGRLAPRRADAAIFLPAIGFGDPHHVVRVEGNAVHQQWPGRQDSGIVVAATLLSTLAVVLGGSELRQAEG